MSKNKPNIADPIQNLERTLGEGSVDIDGVRYPVFILGDGSRRLELTDNGDLKVANKNTLRMLKKILTELQKINKKLSN